MGDGWVAAQIRVGGKKVRAQSRRVVDGFFDEVSRHGLEVC